MLQGVSSGGAQTPPNFKHQEEEAHHRAKGNKHISQAEHDCCCRATVFFSLLCDLHSSLEQGEDQPLKPLPHRGPGVQGAVELKVAGHALPPMLVEDVQLPDDELLLGGDLLFAQLLSSLSLPLVVPPQAKLHMRAQKGEMLQALQATQEDLEGLLHPRPPLDDPDRESSMCPVVASTRQAFEVGEGVGMRLAQLVDLVLLLTAQ
jgi:hypothetical protein